MTYFALNGGATLSRLRVATWLSGRWARCWKLYLLAAACA